MNIEPFDSRSSHCFDLHCHSTRSDGTLTPTEVVQRAHAHGVDVLALTDHDSTDGLEEARSAATRVGLTLVAGSEISVTWRDQLIHIVALDIDVDCPQLRAGLVQQRALRVERAIALADRLARLGIDGSLDAARAQAGSDAPGRNHFARFLVEQGHARDTRQAFKRYLARGGASYVPCRWAGLDEVLAWVQAAGGRAVLAHPGRYGMTRSKLRRFLTEFTAEKGAGIEVISGVQTAEQTRVMADHAQSFGLLASVGSDFHTPGAKWAELGRLPPLPDGCTPVWHDWNVAACST